MKICVTSFMNDLKMQLFFLHKYMQQFHISRWLIFKFKFLLCFKFVSDNETEKQRTEKEGEDELKKTYIATNTNADFSLSRKHRGISILDTRSGSLSAAACLITNRSKWSNYKYDSI